MKEKISELMKNKSFARILFIVGIVGILLIFLSSFIGSGEEKPEKTAEVKAKEEPAPVDKEEKPAKKAAAKPKKKKTTEK